jgi:hypothetical protein
VSASIASAAVAPNEGDILIICKVGMGVGAGVVLGVVIVGVGGGLTLVVGLAVLDPLTITVGVAVGIVVVGLRLVGFIVVPNVVLGLRGVGIDSFAVAVVILMVGVGVGVFATTPVGLGWSAARLFGGVVARSIANNRTTLVLSATPRVGLWIGPRTGSWTGPRSLLLEISFSHPFKFIYPLVIFC